VYFLSFLFLVRGVNPRTFSRSEPGGVSECIFLSTNQAVNTIGWTLYYPICRPLENYGVAYCDPAKIGNLSRVANPLILQPDSLPLPHMAAFVVAMTIAVIYSMRMLAWSLTNFHAQTKIE